MESIKKLLTFLTTLWGALAVTAIAFPGAAALLDVPLAVEHSKISTLYPVLGTISSAFGLLILLSFQEELRQHAFARRLAVRSAAAGFLLFLCFVMVRVAYLDIQVSQRSQPPEVGEYVLRHHSLGIMRLEKFSDGKLVQVEERGDPLDVLALGLFAATFASFTVGFSALGIHTFKTHES
jgi:hypothetical protein